MSEPSVAFVPEPPDPRLEEIDEEIAELVAEALFEYLLRQEKIPPVVSKRGEAEHHG